MSTMEGSCKKPLASSLEGGTETDFLSDKEGRFFDENVDQEEVEEAVNKLETII